MGICAAEGCSITVGSEHLMCKKHWYMVEQDARNEVHSTWRRVRRDPDAYLEAKAEAVRQVAQKEADRSNPNQGALDL